MGNKEKEISTPTGLNANDVLISVPTLSIDNLFVAKILTLPFNYFVVASRK